MDDLYHWAIKPLVGRGGPRDIVKIEVRDRDIDCWIVDLRTRQGKELRLSADSEDEARAMATQIEGWRQRPETVLVIVVLFATAGAPGFRHPFQWARFRCACS